MKFLLLCIAITACANGIPTSQQATLHPSTSSSAKAIKPAAVKDQQALPVRSTTPAPATTNSYVP